VKRFYQLVLPAVVGVVLVAGTVVAQERGPRGQRGGFGGGFGGGNPLMLLNSDQVQRELDLVDEQKEELRKILESSRGDRANFAELRDLPEEERRARMRELREQSEGRVAELQKKVNEVLLPHQQKRLKQIQLQLQGDRALNNPEVAKELGLTDEQQRKLEEVREKTQQQMREAFGQRGEGGDRGANRERLAELREQTQRQVNEVLTADQKKKLEEMKGEPFELQRQPRGQRDGERRGQRGPRDGERGQRGPRDRN